MQVSFDLDQAGLRLFEERLEAMSGRALDAEPAMSAIADDFLVLEREVFASGGTAIGANWQADVASWAAEKAKRGKSSRTLVYTGMLEASLTVPHSKYNLRVTGPGELVVGTLDPVAHMLEAGKGTDRTVNNWRGKPMRKPRSAGPLHARTLVRPTPAAVTRWRNIVSDWLMGDRL